MIKAIFWIGVGATIGVVALNRLNRARAQVNPGNLNRFVGQVSEGIGSFSTEIRQNMKEREAELRTALGIAEEPL